MQWNTSHFDVLACAIGWEGHDMTITMKFLTILQATAWFQVQVLEHVFKEPKSRTQKKKKRELSPSHVPICERDKIAKLICNGKTRATWIGHQLSKA